jgi:regulatory protein
MSEANLYSASLSKAMALCSGREYAPEDIRSKLITWGLGANETEKAVSALIKENFLNERRYAEAYVRDKFNYNKWGRVKIAFNLKSKKISQAIIREAMECIDDENYKEAARSLLELQRKKIKPKNQYDLRGKLMRFGLSRGFEMELLYDILNSF